MSGATPLARKLGIRPGDRILLLRAPNDVEQLIAPLPEAAWTMRVADDEPYAVILLFVTALETLTEQFEEAAARLVPHGGLWIAWPKKTSGKPTDLDGNIVRQYGLSTGLVDNKVCAIDATWSGLRFVIRKENRPRP